MFKCFFFPSFFFGFAVVNFGAFDFDEEIEDNNDIVYNELEDWQKREVDEGDYDSYNFEEDELEEDDYYYEDDK